MVNRAAELLPWILLLFLFLEALIIYTFVKSGIQYIRFSVFIRPITDQNVDSALTSDSKVEQKELGGHMNRCVF